MMVFALYVRSMPLKVKAVKENISTTTTIPMTPPGAGESSAFEPVTPPLDEDTAEGEPPAPAPMDDPAPEEEIVEPQDPPKAEAEETIEL
jgi:hypothetical protein